MTPNDERIDTAGLMRKIRDRMSAEMKDMTFEERRQYIEQRTSRVRDTLLKAENGEE